MGIYQRRREGWDNLSGLVHHSDRGVQYRAFRYGEALDDEQAVASVGSKGDSYDNALAEAVNSLYKAELIRNRGPWTGIDGVEAATSEWVHWFNTTGAALVDRVQITGRVRGSLSPRSCP